MNEDLEKRLELLERQLKDAQSSTASRRSKRMPGFWSKRRIIALTLVALILTAILLVFLLIRPSTIPAPSSIDLKQYAQQADFDVFFPVSLPQGFSLDKASVHYSNGVLIYTIAAPNSSQIIITEQKKPTNFDYGSIQTETSFKTPYGVATAYEQSDKSMGSMVTDNTWVIANSSKSIGVKAMEAVIQSMAKDTE